MKLSAHLVLIMTISIIDEFLIVAANKALIENNLKGLIAAFGDFNSDKSTDVFLITENGKSLEIVKGMPSEPLLTHWTDPVMKCTISNSDEVIMSVIPGDFDGSAVMDVVVVTMDKKKKDHVYKMYLLKGNISHIDCDPIQSNKPFAQNILSQPLVLDYDGDKIADLLVQNESCNMLLYTTLKHNDSVLGPICSLELIEKINHKFSNPHSNAFIDLDYPKDMIPDLFIRYTVGGKDEMIYLLNDEGWTNKSKNITISLPEFKMVGQSTFMDMDFDSNIEHLVPVCKSELESCEEPQIFAFHSKTGKWINVSNFTDESNSSQNLTFAPVEHYGYLASPVTLRYGDIDGDGFPDLLTVMKVKENDANSKKMKAVLLRNVADNNALSNNPFKRKFIVDWTSAENNVELAAFFDLFEDGKLDILMSIKDEKEENMQLVVHPNTQMIDGCFLKVYVASGLCYGTEGVEKCSYGIEYGTTYQPGPFLCYEVHDLDGDLRKGCGGQLSQSAHMSLQLPFSLFGLGSTPNFVETLSATTPMGKKEVVTREWTQIVPDAQVVIIPHKEEWVFKLFLRPANIVFKTLITLASICCFLVLVIGILHRKELLEDLAEHEEYKRHWPESR